MEIKHLSFPADTPPLAVIAAAKVAGIDLPASTVTDSSSPPTLVFSNGKKLQGLIVVLRYIGSVAKLYGQDPFESGQIDEWLEYSHILSTGSKFESACAYINAYLEKSTF